MLSRPLKPTGAGAPLCLPLLPSLPQRSARLPNDHSPLSRPLWPPGAGALLYPAPLSLYLLSLASLPSYGFGGPRIHSPGCTVSLEPFSLAAMASSKHPRPRLPYSPYRTRTSGITTSPSFSRSSPSRSVHNRNQACATGLRPPSPNSGFQCRTHAPTSHARQLVLKNARSHRN